MGRPAVAQDDIGFPIFRIYAVRGLIHHRLSLVINSRSTRSAPLRRTHQPHGPPPNPVPGRGSQPGFHREHRRHRRHVRDGRLVPRVRLFGDLLAGPSGRPRRAEAGAAAHPVHDERHGPAPGPRPRQERPRGGRGHGQAAPARRHRDLRRHGAHGAGLLAAAAADRRARQLRLARRRPGGPAVHRGPPGGGGADPDGPPRRGRRRLRPQLRQPADPAGRAAGRVPQPAGQRRHRHRRRHGHEHGPAQPGGSHRRRPAPDRATRTPRSRTS